MPDVVLGKKPRTLLLQLTDGQDFVDSLAWQTAAGEPIDFPTDSSLVLHLGDTTWPADLSGPNAYWDYDKAQVALIQSGTKVRLIFTNGAVDEVWAKGSVVRG